MFQFRADRRAMRNSWRVARRFRKQETMTVSQLLRRQAQEERCRGKHWESRRKDLGIERAEQILHGLSRWRCRFLIIHRSFRWHKRWRESWDQWYQKTVEAMIRDVIDTFTKPKLAVNQKLVPRSQIETNTSHRFSYSKISIFRFSFQVTPFCCQIFKRFAQS